MNPSVHYTSEHLEGITDILQKIDTHAWVLQVQLDGKEVHDPDISWSQLS